MTLSHIIPTVQSVYVPKCRLLNSTLTVSTEQQWLLLSAFERGRAAQPVFCVLSSSSRSVQEALFLAALGYVPGFLIAIAL